MKMAELCEPDIDRDIQTALAAQTNDPGQAVTLLQSIDRELGRRGAIRGTGHLPGGCSSGRHGSATIRSTPNGSY